MSNINTSPDYVSAALYWFNFGFAVIPVITGEKRPAVTWNDWLKNLSARNIRRHWDEHPEHEVGCIVGDGIIVMDADTTMSATALEMLEERHGLEPGLVVTTARGTHHYYRRAPDTYAKSDSHSSEEHPERIDVKTGRALVVLPPSTGKQVAQQDCDRVDGLSEVGQDFIDDVFLHNGREATRPPTATASATQSSPADMDKETRDLEAMLQYFDPDCGYDDWLHIGMAIHHQTGGDEAGFRLYDAWSSKGDKYPGDTQLRAKWNSFGSHMGPPVTRGTLIKMLADRGVDWVEVCTAAEPPFTSQDTPTTSVTEAVSVPDPLPSDEEVIAQLAAMHSLEYDRVRAGYAERMGCRTTTLDAHVKAARKENGESNDLPFPEVEPWPDPVEAALLLSDLSATIRRFIVMEPEQADAAALWAAFTWVVDAVNVAPLAVINAPEKACGKSLLLEVMGRVSAKPLPVSNVSTAALFRSAELWGPTLQIDEADTFMRTNDDLKGLINAGHTRANAFVLRTVGDNHEPKRFSVWGAKALAGINLQKHLPDATMSRAIVFNLRRKLPHETVERLRHADPRIFEEIAAKLARFAEDYAEQVRRARPALPDALSDRDQDNWEPLLAIAECAGPDWVQRATEAALMLSGSNEGSISTGNELLADIRQVFVRKQVGKIATKNLIHALCEDEEKRWVTYNRGKEITPAQLAKLLAPYGIKSKTVRFSKDTPKGYDRSQFKDAFARYLPAPGDLPQHRHSPPEPSNDMIESGVDTTDVATMPDTDDY